MDPATYERLVLTVNAWAGLTDEQIQAIPRLVAWFREADDPVEAAREFSRLRKLFPVIPRI